MKDETKEAKSLIRKVRESRIFQLLCIGVLSLAVAGVVAISAYRFTHSRQFSLTVGLSVFFGFFTVTALIYGIRSLVSTESLAANTQLLVTDTHRLVQEIVESIETFTTFMKLASEIVGRVREKGNIVTLSVTPALGEVLCGSTLHQEYKRKLGEAIVKKQANVTFFHPTLDHMLPQLKVWANGETKNDRGGGTQD